MNRNEYRELHRLVRAHMAAGPFTRGSRTVIDAALLSAMTFVDRNVVARHPRRAKVLQVAIRIARNRDA